MQTQSIYYEDYEIGHMRETFGRTNTETDFVVHAGHTGDFFPHHMDAECVLRRSLANVSRMAPWCFPSASA